MVEVVVDVVSFNSLIRDHAKGDEDVVPDPFKCFQLPLSGSQIVWTPDLGENACAGFQLPLSGSLRYCNVKVRYVGEFPFNSLSRDHR